MAAHHPPQAFLLETVSRCFSSEGSLLEPCSEGQGGMVFSSKKAAIVSAAG